MAFKFIERSYSGKMFRPRPEIHVDSEAKFILVVTPWGPRSSAKKVIDRMKEYLLFAREDREATSPFPRLSCLSTQANNLRIAALLANDSLYREENTDEFRSGTEIFAGVLEDNEFVWLQIGNPQILLSRSGRALLPLGSQIDHSFDMSNDSSLLPPLPSQLLGLDSSVNFNINSFRFHPGDRLLLLSHSQLPEQVFQNQASQLNLEHLSRTLAMSSPQLAFWLGLLEVSESRGAQSA